MAKTTGPSTQEAKVSEPFFSRSVLIAIAVILVLMFVLGIPLTTNNDGDEVEQDGMAGDSQQQNQPNNQQTDENQNQDVVDQSDDDEQVGSGGKLNYNYVAEEGDSVTTLARQAVFNFDADLTPAERVAAETRLAQENVSATVNIGQNFEFTPTSVEEAVSWAKGISAEAKAAWQPYADMVDWND